MLMEELLKLLENFYLSVTIDKSTLNSFFNKKEMLLCVENQSKILDVTIRNPHSKDYPPPLSYQKFFLRVILDSVEANGCEPSEDLIKAYSDVISVSGKSDWFYRTYLVENQCVITLKENSSFVLNSTTGLQTWEASKYLTEWCLMNSHVFKNKIILELGSGIGLLGLSIIKKCGPLRYIFTDKSEDVLETLAENIKINLESNIETDILQKHMLWGNISIEEANQLAPDIIIGADIVFDPSILPDLVDTIKTFLLHSTTNVYIASTVRNEDTKNSFLTLIGSAGLTYEVLDFCHKDKFIYDQFSQFVLHKIYIAV